MDQLRRVGGALEPIKRPSGGRLLLPYELDLCESLGISPEEYWEFIFAAQEQVKSAVQSMPIFQTSERSCLNHCFTGRWLSAIGCWRSAGSKAKGT